MMNAKTMLAGCALLTSGAAALAQGAPVAPPQNVLQLQASGQVEVQQDLLTMNLTTAKEGPDATAVQAQLKTALETALAEAKKQAQPGQLDVRTGTFTLYPRNNRDGRITGWTGVAELVLEGRDFSRITQAAGRIQTMTLGGVSFGLSREQRARVEGEAQSLAIERFKSRANDLAKGFGFTGYTLREVAVNSNDQGFDPRPRALAMNAKAAMDSQVPVEPGKTSVVVTVSGTVQLR